MVTLPALELSSTPRQPKLSPKRNPYTTSTRCIFYIFYTVQGEVTVAAPIGQPPVFYRKSSTYDFEKLKLPLVPVPTANPGSGNTGNYLLFPYLTLSTTLLISYALAKF